MITGGLEYVQRPETGGATKDFQEKVYLQHQGLECSEWPCKGVVLGVVKQF
jgi:hypothetical protein